MNSSRVVYEITKYQYIECILLHELKRKRNYIYLSAPQSYMYLCHIFGMYLSTTNRVLHGKILLHIKIFLSLLTGYSLAIKRYVLL